MTSCRHVALHDCSERIEARAVKSTSRAIPVHTYSNTALTQKPRMSGLQKDRGREVFLTRQDVTVLLFQNTQYIKVRCPYIEGTGVGGLSGMRAPPRGWVMPWSRNWFNGTWSHVWLWEVVMKSCSTSLMRLSFNCFLVCGQTNLPAPFLSLQAIILSLFFFFIEGNI